LYVFAPFSFGGGGFDESNCPRLSFIRVGLNTFKIRISLHLNCIPGRSKKPSSLTPTKKGLHEDPRIVAARDRGHQIETHGYSIWDSNQ
jgi:hypothetical protein